MKKYQLGYIELQGKKKNYFWVEMIAGFVIGIIVGLMIFGG